MASAFERAEAGRTIPRYVGKGPGGTLTAEEARGLLERQARSGKSFKAFAEGLGLTGSQLYWWRKKFDRDAARGRPGAAPRAPFVPVVVGGADAPPTATAAAPAAPAPFVLSRAPGERLEIPPDFPEAALRTLLRVLREAP